MTKKKVKQVNPSVPGQRPINFTGRMTEQLEWIQNAKRTDGRSATVKFAVECFAEAVQADGSIRAKDIEAWVNVYIDEAYNREDAVPVTVYFSAATVEGIDVIGNRLLTMTGKVPTLRTVLIAARQHTFNRTLIIALALEWTIEAIRREGNPLTLLP